jgi:hypothetical protein
LAFENKKIKAKYKRFGLLRGGKILANLHATCHIQTRCAQAEKN